MTLRLFLVFLLGLGATGAQATSLMTMGASRSSAAAGGSFVGLGDVHSGASFYVGWRAYDATAATAGAKSINIRRASDSTTTDIVVLSNGNLDVATATTFCAATTCFLTKSYDQSRALNCSGAACDCAQATAAKQPQLVFNDINTSLPGVRFVGSSVQNLVCPSISTIAQPLTIGFAAKRTTVSGALETVFASNPDSPQVGYDASANNLFLYAGSAVVNAAATDNAFHNIFAVLAGASSALNVDGSSTTLSPGTSGLGGALIIGDTNSGGHPLTADVLEVIVYPPPALSGSVITNLCHNMFNYWATSTAC